MDFYFLQSVQLDFTIGHLILKYKLDKNEREILNTIFSEVQDELLDLVRHRK